MLSLNIYPTADCPIAPKPNDKIDTTLIALAVSDILYDTFNKE